LNWNDDNHVFAHRQNSAANGCCLQRFVRQTLSIPTPESISENADIQWNQNHENDKQRHIKRLVPKHGLEEQLEKPIPQEKDKSIQPPESGRKKPPIPDMQMKRD
jgi:hypothetical protein